MRLFRDATGREWTLDLDLATVKRVNAEVSLDHAPFHLLRLDQEDASGQALVLRLLHDDVLLADVLWALCRPAAEAAKIDYATFCRQTLAGETLNAAANALHEELADFIRPRRPQLVQWMETEHRVLEQVMGNLAGRLDSIDTSKLARALAEMALPTPAGMTAEVPPAARQTPKPTEKPTEKPTPG